jgi:transcriptional antiterminator NusG
MSAGTNTVAESKWYALRVVSGKERKIRDYIENEVKRSNWGTFISQILVPTEKIYKVVNGKKTIKEKNFFPGYVLIEAVEGKLNGDIIQTLRNITGVIHFLGKDTPTPLRKSEVNRILGKVDEQQESGETLNEPFLVGEKVRITDGPFNDFKGTIEEINEEKKKLKVVVMIFGRRTPVEVNFMQVEKAQ